jgi:hypothetical protein
LSFYIMQERREVASAKEREVLSEARTEIRTQEQQKGASKSHPNRKRAGAP